MARAWETLPKLHQRMYAELQATLHNAWCRGDSHKVYTADDFLGKGKTVDPQAKVEEQVALFSATMEAASSHFANTPQHLREHRANVEGFQKDEGAGARWAEIQELARRKREERANG